MLLIVSFTISINIKGLKAILNFLRIFKRHFIITKSCQKELTSFLAIVFISRFLRVDIDFAVSTAHDLGQTARIIKATCINLPLSSLLFSRFPATYITHTHRIRIICSLFPSYATATVVAVAAASQRSRRPCNIDVGVAIWNREMRLNILVVL